MVKSKKARPVVMAIIIITGLSMVSLGGLFGPPNIQSTPDNIGDVECFNPQVEEVQQQKEIQLTIVASGEEAPIPNWIGLNEETCLYEIFTGNASGTVNIASPDPDKTFTLGDFFAVWGQPFSESELINLSTNASNIIVVQVDGERSDEYENLVLEDGQNIRIEYLNIIEGGDPEPATGPADDSQSESQDEEVTEEPQL